MRKQPRGQYRGYRLAGIRMSEELEPAFTRGREDDERGALYAFHMYDKAHNVMLTEEGIIPREAGAQILEGFRELESEPGGAVEARARIGGGMHSGEYHLFRTRGEEVGGWDHVGRSSACLGVVGRRIQQRDGLLDLLDALNGFRRILLDLAGRHLDAPMPGFYGTQVVQPTSFGHYLMSTTQGLERHAERARDAYRRVNLNPGGGVVLTGTAFPINRERVAELLGFDGVVVHPADAIQGNDTALECFAVLAMLGQQVERLSEDFARWFASENRFVSVPDRYIAGSSLAMQMKTPLPFGRAMTFNLVGDLVKAFSQAGTQGGINPDRSFQAMAGTLRLYGQMLACVRFDRERALEAARMGNSGGTDLGALLVTARNVPWRSAHQICGILFRFCEERGIAAQDITGALLDEAAVEYDGQPLGLADAQIQEAMDPAHIIASRRHTGGAAPDQAKAQLDDQLAAVAADEAWVADRRAAIAAAAAALEAAIDALVKIDVKQQA